MAQVFARAGGTGDAWAGSSMKAKTIPRPFPTGSELKCLQTQPLALGSVHYRSIAGSFSLLFYFFFLVFSLRTFAFEILC